MSDARIADELAIRNLVARYADAVAAKDRETWAATWAPDGEWNLMGRAAEGRESIVELWLKLIEGFSLVMQVATNGVIDVAGDRATGRWTVNEYGWTTAGGGVVTLGLYRDTYARVDGAWLFARRRFDLLYSGPPDLSGSPLPYPGTETA